MSVLSHGDLTTEERDAHFGRKRDGAVPSLTEERRAALAAGEQFLLTVRDDGFGKRTSTHDYRLTRRGGKGVINMVVGEGERRVVAAFPVADRDEIMLVTDGGRLIRCPVDGISKVGRGARGVTLFRLAGGERVVSAARLAETNGDVAAADEAVDAGAAGDG